jgi:hypothetical protein
VFNVPWSCWQGRVRAFLVLLALQVPRLAIFAMATIAIAIAIVIVIAIPIVIMVAIAAGDLEPI